MYLNVKERWKNHKFLDHTRIIKKDALLNGSFSHIDLEKLIEILDHYEALRKYFYLASICYTYSYLFSFRCGISLSENIAHFCFSFPM